MIIPLLPLLPLFPFPLTWNPPSCDRIRPPLLWVARKLTPAFPSPVHLVPYPKSRPPGVSQTRNRHSLGRHCKPIPYAHLQEVRQRGSEAVDRAAVEQWGIREIGERQREWLSSWGMEQVFFNSRYCLFSGKVQCYSMTWK